MAVPVAAPGARGQVATAAAVPVPPAAGPRVAMAVAAQPVATAAAVPPAADSGVAAPRSRRQVAASAPVPVPPATDPGVAAPGTRGQVAAAATVPVPPASAPGVAVAAPGQKPVDACPAFLARQRRRPIDDGAAETRELTCLRVLSASKLWVIASCNYYSR
jgi:ribonuclease E